MPDIKIRDVIDGWFDGQDCEHAEDYKLFRTIEDWCLDNLDKTRWRFDYSSTTSVCGIDVPGRIIFGREEDVTAFRLRFCGVKPVDLCIQVS